MLVYACRTVGGIHMKLQKGAEDIVRHNVEKENS